jgi:hypothetical protein
LGFYRQESQIVAALCGNLNTQDIAATHVRGVAMVPNLNTIELGKEDV